MGRLCTQNNEGKLYLLACAVGCGEEGGGGGIRAWWLEEGGGGGIRAWWLEEGGGGGIRAWWLEEGGGGSFTPITWFT